MECNNILGYPGHPEIWFAPTVTHISKKNFAKSHLRVDSRCYPNENSEIFISQYLINLEIIIGKPHVFIFMKLLCIFLYTLSLITHFILATLQ